MWGNLSHVDTTQPCSDPSSFVYWVDSVREELATLKQQKGIEVVRYVCTECGGICCPVLLNGDSFPCHKEFSISDYVLHIIPGTYTKDGKFMHTCSECGKTYMLDKVYPDLIFSCE